MDKTSKELQLKYVGEKIARLDMQIKALEEKKAQALEDYRKLMKSCEEYCQPLAIFNNSELRIFLYSDHVDIYDPLHESAPFSFNKDDVDAIEVVLSDDQDFASFRFNPMENALLSEAEFESNKDCSSHPTIEDGKKIYALFKDNWGDKKVTLRTGLNQRYYW